MPNVKTIKLNKIGQDAVKFWEENKVGSPGIHPSITVTSMINNFFKTKNMDSKVVQGTSPKNHNIAFLVYSGQDADFDYEGRVEWHPLHGSQHLIETLEMLGIECYE